MLVLSVIWISSIEIIGGRSIGFFNKNGKLIDAIKIINKWKVEEITIFLITTLPFFIRLRN